MNDSIRQVEEDRKILLEIRDLLRQLVATQGQDAVVQRGIAYDVYKTRRGIQG